MNLVAKKSFKPKKIIIEKKLMKILINNKLYKLIDEMK